MFRNYKYKIIKIENNSNVFNNIINTLKVISAIDRKHICLIQENSLVYLLVDKERIQLARDRLA